MIYSIFFIFILKFTIYFNFFPIYVPLQIFPTCLEPDQIPQGIRQSLMSLPNDSRLPFLPSSEIQSNMIEINVGQEKQAGKKYPCPEPDCAKSYTQFHNLKSHRRKKHNSI